MEAAVIEYQFLACLIKIESHQVKLSESFAP